MEFVHIKNFSTLGEAIDVQNQVNAMLLDLLKDLDSRNSLKVVHDEPEVWRLWMQLGQVRVNLHTIFTCDDPFMHFHPSNSIVQVVRGSYQNRAGSYNGSIDEFMKNIKLGSVDDLANNLVSNTTIIVPGATYFMLDKRNAHSVKVQSESSSSIMITGTPYWSGASKDLSRKQPTNNPELTPEEKLQVAQPIIDFLSHTNK